MTESFFLVSERRWKGEIPIYRSKDFLNEDIKGNFCQPERLTVESRESDIFKMEKILNTKGRGRNKTILCETITPFQHTVTCTLRWTPQCDRK